MKERRGGARFSLSGSVEVTRNGKKKRGVIRDLSLNGAYISIENDFEPFESIDISISIQKDKKSLETSLKGVVCRRDEAGIGVQFTRMDLDSFRIIRDMAKIYAEDPEKIESEMRRLSASIAGR